MIFFRHLDSTSITDILYHFISDSGEQRSNTIKWYEDINLIDGLIQQFLTTESKSVQINVTSLLSEFLRLAFDQQIGLDSDLSGPTLSATIERLLYGRNDTNAGISTSNQHLSSGDDEKKLSNIDTEEKLTPVVLAQHILSKSNLEQLFDTLIKRPTLVASGCDFLENILDLLSRHMPVPLCIPLTSDEKSSLANPDEKDEPMQIDDEGDTLPVIKTIENETALTKLAKDSLVRIYTTLLEVIPSRLPSLIALLSTPCAPLIPSTNDNSQTGKYQFINEPLGSMRLNLIKFFSKLIYTISNDHTGDKIYEILNVNRLFHILIDLLLRYVYNNFLHTQVYLIIRLIIHINSLAVKQSNDIWSRTPISKDEPFSEASSFHYTNRCSYKLFQSLSNSSEINLFGRLLDQYEVNIASKNSSTTNSTSEDASIQTRFTSPNSGHSAQILRYLRDQASIFDNYSSYLKSNNQEQSDENTNPLETRWQTAMDNLNEDEKKWSAMHHNERATNNFRLSSATNYFSQITSSNDSEASLRRRTFHMRGFGGKPYIDDDDEEDDEVERFDIDDEMMKNEQTTNEGKVAEMKKISFEAKLPAQFNEQSLWYQTSDVSDMKNVNNDTEKMTSAPALPNLFENHRNQQEKTSSSTESNFEQLCSLRANDSGSDSGLFPFQSSSTIREEALSNDDVFWQNHPVYLANSNENQQLNKSHTQPIDSSSEDDSDIVDDDEEESKIDSNIPDDEKYFVHTDMDTNEHVQSNNMMDIFRRQPSISNEEKNASEMYQKPISSSTPERDTSNQVLSPSRTNENKSRKTLTFTGQDEQQNGQPNSDDDDDDDLSLQNNFSFLIAKGMLKPSSS